MQIIKPKNIFNGIKFGYIRKNAYLCKRFILSSEICTYSAEYKYIMSK